MYDFAFERRGLPDFLCLTPFGATAFVALYSFLPANMGDPALGKK